MKRILYAHFVAVSVALGAVSCSSDSATSSTGKTYSRLPTSVGSRWTYAYWGRQGEQDTVDVEVVGVGTSPQGEPAKVWRHSFRTIESSPGVLRVDMHYLVESADTTRIYLNRPPEIITYLLPFEVGKSWTSGYAHPDTTTVTGAPAMVPWDGGFLSAGFWVERSWTEGTGFNEQSRVLIVPSVGVVQMELKAIFATGITDEVWRLQAYDLAD